MTLDKQITVGNLVSWSLLLAAFVAGWATVKANTTRALDVAIEAKKTADESKDQINVLKTDIEVIKATTKNTDKTVEDIRQYLISRGR